MIIVFGELLELLELFGELDGVGVVEVVNDGDFELGLLEVVMMIVFGFVFVVIFEFGDGG